MALASIRNCVWGMTFFAAASSGLMAGVFFAFSNFVMGALDAMPATEAIAAMQSINVKVLNPVFFVVFLGPAICSVMLAAAVFVLPSQAGRLWLFAGCMLYLLGAVVVTGTLKAPLNNGLARLQIAEMKQAQVVWLTFRSQWQTWNHVRTISSLLASICFSMALTRILKAR